MVLLALGGHTHTHTHISNTHCTVPPSCWYLVLSRLLGSPLLAAQEQVLNTKPHLALQEAGPRLAGSAFAGDHGGFSSKDCQSKLWGPCTSQIPPAFDFLLFLWWFLPSSALPVLRANLWVFCGPFCLLQTHIITSTLKDSHLRALA